MLKERKKYMRESEFSKFECLGKYEGKKNGENSKENKSLFFLLLYLKNSEIKLE